MLKLQHSGLNQIYSQTKIEYIRPNGEKNVIYGLVKQFPNQGLLITIDEANKLIKDLLTFVSDFSETDIENYNSCFLDKQYEDIANYRPPVHKTNSGPRRYVYLFYSPLLDKYKIGISVNVEGRVKEFIQDEAIIVTHSRLLDDARTQEYILHQQYKEYNVGGEWFKFPTSELIEEVKQKIDNL